MPLEKACLEPFESSFWEKVLARERFAGIKVQCPRCNSKNTIGNGYTSSNTKRFLCNNCCRSFIEPKKWVKMMKREIASKIEIHRLKIEFGILEEKQVV